MIYSIAIVANTISALQASDKEGWAIQLLNWHGDKNIKLIVHDQQLPTHRFKKALDTVTTSFGQWLHFVAVYRYIDPLDPPSQFHVYRNGQDHNNGGTDKQAWSFTGNTVETIALGRRYIGSTGPPYADAVLDELLIFPGVLDASMAQKLYHHYT